MGSSRGYFNDDGTPRNNYNVGDAMPNDLPERLPLPGGYYLKYWEVEGAYQPYNAEGECILDDEGDAITPETAISFAAAMTTAAPLVKQLCEALENARNRVRNLGAMAGQKDWDANEDTFIPRYEKAIADGTAWLAKQEGVK